MSLPFKIGVLNAGGIPRALRVIGELPRGGSFPKPFLYSGALRWDVIEKHAGNLSVTFFQEVWTLRDVRALLLRISYSHAFLGKKKRNTPCFLWSNNCSGLLTIVQDKTLLVTDSGRLSYDECSGILWLGRADCNAKKGGQWICLSLSNGSEVCSFNTHLDAGRSDDDETVRRAQLSQIATVRNVLERRHPNAALLFVGDLNTRIGAETLGLVDFSGTSAWEEPLSAMEDGTGRALYTSGICTRMHPARGHFAIPKDIVSDHEFVTFEFTVENVCANTIAHKNF